MIYSVTSDRGIQILGLVSKCISWKAKMIGSPVRHHFWQMIMTCTRSSTAAGPLTLSWGYLKLYYRGQRQTLSELKSTTRQFYKTGSLRREIFKTALGLCHKQGILNNASLITCTWLVFIAVQEFKSHSITIKKELCSAKTPAVK